MTVLYACITGTLHQFVLLCRNKLSYMYQAESKFLLLYTSKACNGGSEVNVAEPVIRIGKSESLGLVISCIPLD